MKTLLLICGLFTQTINCNYNVVLLGKNKDGAYCYAKVNLEEAKKARDISKIINFTGIYDSQVLSIVFNSVYSSMIDTNDDHYSLEIDTTKPSNCYKKIKSKFRHPDGYLEATIRRLGSYLATLYYGKVNEEPAKYDDKLLKELSELNISLSLKHDSDIKCFCVCIIKEEQLEECVSSIAMNSNL